VNESIEEIASRRDAIGGLVPFLDAIRSIAEIAWRRAEQRAEPLGLYRRQLDAILDQTLRSVGAEERAGLLSWPGQPTAAPTTGLLLVTAERGLCGSFVERLITFGLDQSRALQARGEAVRLLCLGRRGERRLAAEGYPLIYRGSLPSLAIPTYLEVEHLALDLLDLAERGAFTRLVIVRNAPARRFQYEPGVQTLLPLDVTVPKPGISRSLVKPVADAPALLSQVLTEHFLLDLYGAILESALSEQLARVFAMRLAADNAHRLVDELTDAYNLAARYAATSALLETIAGYETTLNQEQP